MQYTRWRCMEYFFHTLAAYTHKTHNWLNRSEKRSNESVLGSNEWIDDIRIRNWECRSKTQITNLRRFSQKDLKLGRLWVGKIVRSDGLSLYSFTIVFQSTAISRQRFLCNNLLIIDSSVWKRGQQRSIHHSMAFQASYILPPGCERRVSMRRKERKKERKKGRKEDRKEGRKEGR